MGVENLLLSDKDYTRGNPVDGVLVYAAEDGRGPRDMRLVWETEFGAEWNETWHIEVTATGTKKGSYLSTSERVYSGAFPAAECNPTNRYDPEANADGLYESVWWSHSLDIGGLMEEFAPNGWTYSGRAYDGIGLRVRVWSDWPWEYEGMHGSDTASRTLSINFCPDYEITDVYYDLPDLIVIEYSAEGWTRTDDRYWIDPESGIYGSVSVAGFPWRRPLLVDEEWGTVAARGRIELPSSEVTEVIKGKRVYLRVCFNAEYRPREMFFDDAVFDGVVEDRSSCNTPTLKPSANANYPYCAVVRVGDSGDEGKPISSVTVKLRGSKYAADEVTVGVGKDAVLRFPPLGVPYAVEAVGTNGKAVSRAASLDMPAIDPKGNTVVDSIYGQSRSGALIDGVSMLYRALVRMREEGSPTGPSVTASANTEEVQLAGRRRKSVFYGSSGTTEVSFGGVYLGQDASVLESLPEKGPVMCRFPDGRRYAVAAEVSIERQNSYVVEVDVSGEEVDA